MIEQEHIQISISVIIKKSRLGAVGWVIQSEFLSRFPEGEVPQVDEELIAPDIGFSFSGVANIYIQQTVVVDIRHGDTGLPMSGAAFDAGT